MTVFRLSAIPLVLLAMLTLASTAVSMKAVFRKIAVTTCSLHLLFGSLQSALAADDGIMSIGDIAVSFKEQRVPMKTLLGSKATLVFNFAGQCDLPADGEPQCRDLAKLYSMYKAEGLQVLAFPSEQFRDASMLGEREAVEDIRENLAKNYGIDFPIMDYVAVNGGDAAEVYKVMNDIKSIRPKDLKKIEWNYEKYLIDSNGKPVRRYRPGIMPRELEGDISDLIKTGKLKPRAKAALGAF
jgi:glutathione peroxidase